MHDLFWAGAYIWSCEIVQEARALKSVPGRHRDVDDPAGPLVCLVEGHVPNIGDQSLHVTVFVLSAKYLVASGSRVVYHLNVAYHLNVLSEMIQASCKIKVTTHRPGRMSEACANKVPDHLSSKRRSLIQFKRAW
jgi:hypothetical protein